MPKNDSSHGKFISKWHKFGNFPVNLASKVTQTIRIKLLEDDILSFACLVKYPNICDSFIPPRETGSASLSNLRMLRRS